MTDTNVQTKVPTDENAVIIHGSVTYTRVKTLQLFPDSYDQTPLMIYEGPRGEDEPLYTPYTDDDGLRMVATPFSDTDDLAEWEGWFAYEFGGFDHC